MEVKQTEGSEIGFSFDGTWQRGGDSLLNGVSTAIFVSTGKDIDCESVWRLCKTYATHSPLKGNIPEEYQAW